MPKKRKQLLTSEDAKPRKAQHKKPCSDCPWARTALPGWLGSMTPQEWLAVAHGDVLVDCHTVGNQQCAGLAIYRSNVCKQVQPPIITLPVDREAVFATPMQFMEHHSKLPVPNGQPVVNPTLLAGVIERDLELEEDDDDDDC